jgi:hypothetical protein
LKLHPEQRQPSEKTASSPPSPAKREIALRRCRLALLWTLCFECLSWPLRYYEFIIYSYLPPVFYDWGPPLFTIITLATEIYSIYLPFRYFRAARFRSFYPFIVIVIAHYVISATGPANTNITSYHTWFKNERENIVASYCSGKISLEPGDCEKCVRLPKEWQRLSLMSDHLDITCDEIKTQALFYTRWGFFSYWEALLYRADGSYPDDPLILRSYKITRLDDNWFYIIH